MSSLEAEAEKRKARLQALSKSLKKGGQISDSLESNNSSLKLKNYKAALEKESRFSSRSSRLPENYDSTLNDNRHNEQDTVENSVAGLVETAVQQDDIGELDISAIAPKRANWDLKRDLQKRLDQLKPKNDAAVADIIRKRIQDSSNLEELHSAVEAHSQG
ncbi:hypothetical protein H4S08_002400 [Coemansia sp. RSA 1365]|nr:hypothetical protein H4S08_002400 [Coemansia sp. RSA 1365]